MVISAALQTFLFIFEILTCVKAEGSRVTWLTAFSPLFFLLVATLIACIWAWRNDRNVEFEIFVLSNVLQIIFLSLRLDNFINWDWQLVLIPLWIELCVLGFVILYFIIWACLIYHSDNVLPEGQKLGLVLALLFTIAYITAIIFIAILVEKVDNNVDIPYAIVFISLHIALFALLLTSCLHRGGNQWWFGMQKSFCNSLLICLPWLQEYGNISFSAEAVEEEEEEEERETSPARLEDLKIEIKYSSDSDVKRKKERRDSRSYNVYRTA
ncbi:transmembrane protein 185B-like [Oscarella lobularis]|uniref:transmembrane protein 185B-like n=1 Tax=Oscarella lobularis TaxID=121494 RepID=UPI0033140BFD